MTSPSALGRTYENAAVSEQGGAFLVLLDGKPAKTPRGAPLGAPTRSLAEAVAREWNAQGATVEFASMPLTRLTTATIEFGDALADDWRETVLSVLDSDLLCYRAGEPAALVERQIAEWDPLLDWARDVLGVNLSKGVGVAFIDQPPAARKAAELALKDASPAELLAIKMAAEITGSAVIALALTKRAFPRPHLFAASRIDEEFQASRWGLDGEARARANRLERDFAEVAQFLSLL